MSIAEGAIIGGKLKLVRPLAKGGMGAVWVARHQLLDTDVAVKFMEGSIAENESARGRFEREAKAAALIKSPHVVQVLDYGIEGTTPYIVMELLEGEDLGNRLERVRRLDMESCYRILEPIGKALRRAHDLGIVHRDLKPGNIFIARSGDDEIVKILDFGIAKDVTVTGAATSTSSGMMLGSPAYMSPEQIRATKAVDHRSDLWSIGVILYESLTGRLPFEEAENIGKLLVDICTSPFEPPSTHVPSLNTAVDQFFAKALAREQAARFQSMSELVEAFGVLAGIRPATRSGSLTNETARISVDAVPRSEEEAKRMGSDATLVIASPPTEQLAAAAKSGETTAPRPPDPRSTLSPAESGSFSASPRKRIVPVVAAVVFALCAVAGFFVSRSRGTSDVVAAGDTTNPNTQGGAGANPPPSVAPGEALRSARVAIDPKDATAEVNGRPVAVDKDGFVTISGALGSTHALRVFTKDGREARAEIAITANGALPDKLGVAPADAKTSDTKPAVVTTKTTKGSVEPARTQPTATAPVPTTKNTGKTSNDPQPVRDFQ